MPDDETKSPPAPEEAPTDEKRPEDELAAAFSHLKSAADLFAKKLDPAVRRAAGEAEKALEKVASETERAAAEIQTAAKPIAAKVGGELGKLAGGFLKAVQGLERAGRDDAETEENEKGDPSKKEPPDPDDPNASSI